MLSVIAGVGSLSTSSGDLCPGPCVHYLQWNKDCKTFMSKVKEVAETQAKKEERGEVPDTAKLLEKLSVEDGKTKVKKQDEVPSAAKEERVEVPSTADQHEKSSVEDGKTEVKKQDEVPSAANEDN
ncbi:hypothetical protein PanWU01x14_218200 [Parasponia andersonii]|uniref:Uncharacterized protein n=1 Tax=Parasponia andersonii TaxID=3476 RepID=A0A2P5BQM5_PARAD|nr:hypothetical protein PanWU01x14_218200 [Parasponia andersonii]